jgi:transcriptional regulator of arginine metabolism
MKIIEIIKNSSIETQEELAEQLKIQGINATQATISRDIKELHLIKVLDKGNKYKYAAIKGSDTGILSKLKNVFLESVVEINSALNIIVIKTLPGMAQAAAAAIDAMNFDEIIGSIAGDDTIMVVTGNEEKSALLVNNLKKCMK